MSLMNRHLVSSASFALLLCVGEAGAAALAPHRAYYDLEVKRLEQGGGISTIKGKLAYEITGSVCDGYAVNYRIANRFAYAEGGIQVIDTQMTSWESGDGLEMDLSQKQFLDAKLTSESRVKVKKPANDRPGDAEAVLPVPKQFQTDAKAIFPTAFQVRLIEAALKGESRDETLIYEGADDEKPMRVISFISPKRSKVALSNEAPETDVTALNKLPSWPVSISYYPIEGNGDDEPVYQASFTMLENGISTDLVLDFGTYALAGKLSKLVLLKAEPCK